MYIEFRLPTGGGGGGAQYVNWHIQEKLEAWAKKYNVKYTKKNIKYNLRVTFEDNALYSLFALTWDTACDPDNMFKFHLIETLNVDRY
jgi:hypothetical protein